MTIEGFTLTIMFKNIFSFILTWYAYDWLIQSGMRMVFIVISSIQVGVCLLSIPMCECPLSHALETGDEPNRLKKMYMGNASEPFTTATTL